MASDPELPVEGGTELDLRIGELFAAFREAESWPAWNPCFAWVWVPGGGALREGAWFAWLFHPIRRRYLYRLPAAARIVEYVPDERVTWEVRAPGFHARHTYRFERAGDDRSRLSSWEVAEGALYRATRRFWLAHFRYVCRESLRGGEILARRGVGVRLRTFGPPATDAPPLLAVPGLDGSPGSIAPLVERLAQTRRVIVADYGAERCDSIEALGAEVAGAARAELGDAQVDVLGQSIGTLVVASMLRDRTLRARRTVLIGTFTRVRDGAVRVATTASTFTPRALQKLTTPPLMALVCGPVRDGRRHPFFAAVRASDPAAGRKRTLWQAGRDFTPLLRDLDGPTLVLLGGRDRFPPRGDRDRVRAALGERARVVEIPDAGHVLLPSAAIARAGEEIERFLG
jgi:pimeloyl-ACP methyl ester carboxylesterase